MPRSRNIKPALFKNEVLGIADPLLTILFEGLWCLADREGRLEDRPLRIKAEIFPYREEITKSVIDEYLNFLSTNRFINRYSIAGLSIIQIKAWAKHQNPHHKEIASVLPSQPDHRDTVCDGYIPLSNTMREKIYERDGKICAYCKSTKKLNIDHVTPINKGGNTGECNLQVLCSSCNGLKGNNIIDNELCKSLGKVVIDPSMNHAWINKNTSSPLIPDSLNLIPDSSKSLLSENKFSDDDLKLAKLIFDRISIVAPKTKPPDLDTWADTIRLMRENDGHSLEEIKQIFLFANNSDFWKSNILSVSKLRKQFATLHAQMINPNQKPKELQIREGAV